MKFQKPFIFFISLFLSLIASAQLDTFNFAEQKIIDGDTLLLQSIPEVEIVNKGRFMSSDERRHFYKLRRNLLKVYPYAMYAVDLYNDIQNETDELRWLKKRRYIKDREKDVRDKFEEDVRNFTKSQGHLFVQLINRETGGNCYDVISEVKSGFVAFNWQRIGLLFGYNLRETYDPKAEENEDIELIIRMIENQQPGYLTKVLH
ncbi:MAG: DUF4294 domain-containing protein [Chitinophagales bacterium]